MNFIPSLGGTYVAKFAQGDILEFSDQATELHEYTAVGPGPLLLFFSFLFVIKKVHGRFKTRQQVKPDEALALLRYTYLAMLEFMAQDDNPIAAGMVDVMLARMVYLDIELTAQSPADLCSELVRILFDLHDLQCFSRKPWRRVVVSLLNLFSLSHPPEVSRDFAGSSVGGVFFGSNKRKNDRKFVFFRCTRRISPQKFCRRAEISTSAVLHRCRFGAALYRGGISSFPDSFGRD